MTIKESPVGVILPLHQLHPTSHPVRGVNACKRLFTTTIRFVSYPLGDEEVLKAERAEVVRVLANLLPGPFMRPSQANRHNQNTPAEQSDVADAKQSEPCLICQ